MMKQVKYDVEVPKGEASNRMPERKAIADFLLTKHSNMAIEYGTNDEAKKRRNTVGSMCRKEKIPVKISVPSGSKVMYILRKESK